MEVKPGYKQTEVGVIPEDWEIEQIAGLERRRLLKLGRGQVISRLDIERTPGDFPIYSSSVHNEGEFGRYGHFMFDEELITWSIDGGGHFFWRPKHKFSVTNVCGFMRVDIERICYAFMASVLQLLHSRKSFDYLSKAHPSVIRKEYAVPLPALPEQRAIAAALSDVDALRDGLDRLIAKKRDLKQAAMQQLLTGQTRLPGFRGAWEVKRLGELAEIVSGGTPSTSEPSFWNGSIKWCTPTDITRFSGKYLIETERTISRDGLHNSGADLLPVGALLLCSRATIGEIKIAGSPICTNQGFKSLICRPQVSNEFLYYKLLTMKQQMVERAFGSTFLEISTRNVSSLETNVPPNDEQVAIAAVLSDMDAELAALESRRDKSRDLKQAMMQELLTGRTRLV